MHKRERCGKGQEKFWRIGAYIRLSREDGNDESLSVTNQKKIIDEYLKHSFRGRHQLAEYYVDDGQTGTDYDRPAFRQMLQDMEEGRINCIVCKNLSRMFRNYSDQGYFLENIFPRHRIRFIAISSPEVDSFLRPESLEGLEVPISGLMNDRFAAKTSRDVRDTLAVKRKRGEFIGAFAPYGYKKAEDDRNRLVIDEEAGEVVRQIYHWFVREGMGKRGICRRLNALGIPSPSAYKKKQGFRYYNPRAGEGNSLWSPKTVGRILKNQVYIGNMVQGRQRVVSYKVHMKEPVPEEEWYVVSHTHPPLVEKELFERAQQLQETAVRESPGEGKPHLFSGFLRCGCCGKSMTRHSARGGVYYRCRTNREKSAEACPGYAVKEDRLYGAVLAALRLQVRMSPGTDRVREELAEAPENAGSRGFAVLAGRKREELEESRALRDGLYEDWKKGVIAWEEYTRLKEKYSVRVKQLERDVRAAEGEAALRETGEGVPGLEAFVKSGNIGQLDRGMLSELVRTIFVFRDGVIKVELRFPDPTKEN